MNSCQRKKGADDMKLMDVPEKRLPPDFADRLVKAVRRRRRARKLRMVALVAAIGILGTGLVGGFCCREEKEGPTGTYLVAANASPTNDTQVSSLMLLGFFRECFRRARTNKKKEED